MLFTWFGGPFTSPASASLAEKPTSATAQSAIASNRFVMAIYNRHGPLSLRWIYLHTIEELARPAGHGDILREQILTSDAPELSD